MKCVGHGTYGTVYRKADGLAMKQVEKFDPNRKNFEFTSICEIAILSIRGIPNIPRLNEIKSDNHRYYITMEDCGNTLLQHAATLNTLQRRDAVPGILFQLLESAIALYDLGMFHSDIKSSNVMIKPDNNVKLIDFGIHSFEVVGKIDKNLMSKPYSCYTPQWGTYCICPPETFLHNVWDANKYMVWSIGITICEFIFKSHSFICDYLLQSDSQAVYQDAYKCDSKIRYFMAMLFYSKMQIGETTLAEFKSSKRISPEVAEFLSKALVLDHNKRATLQELFKLPLFDKVRQQNKSQIVHLTVKDKTLIFAAPVKAPMLYTHSNGNYYIYRKLAIEWMFDVYNSTNKLQLLVHAVNIFDRYIAEEPVLCADIALVACSATYLSQYLISHDMIDIHTLLNSLSLLSPTMPSSKIEVSDIVGCVNHIFHRLQYKLYCRTFDVLMAKEGVAVDFDIVSETLITQTPPYNNSKLINTYVSLVKKYERMKEIYSI